MEFDGLFCGYEECGAKYFDYWFPYLKAKKEKFLLLSYKRSRKQSLILKDCLLKWAKQLRGIGVRKQNFKSEVRSQITRQYIIHIYTQYITYIRYKENKRREATQYFHIDLYSSYMHFVGTLHNLKNSFPKLQLRKVIV